MSLIDTVKSYFRAKAEEPREFIKESKKISFEDMNTFYKKYEKNPLFISALGSYCIIEKLMGRDPLKV